MLIITNYKTLIITTTGSQLGVLPPPPALTGLPAITTVAGGPPPLVFRPGSGESSVSSDTASWGPLNLLLISVSRALPLTSGVYVWERLPQIGSKDIEVGISRHVREAARVLAQCQSGGGGSKASTTPLYMPDDGHLYLNSVVCVILECTSWSLCWLCPWDDGLHGDHYTGEPWLLRFSLGKVWYDASFRHLAAITGNHK